MLSRAKNASTAYTDWLDCCGLVSAAGRGTTVLRRHREYKVLVIVTVVTLLILKVQPRTCQYYSVDVHLNYI